MSDERRADPTSPRVDLDDRLESVAFALGKPIALVSLPPETEGKSFQNMLRAWVRECA